MDAAVRAVDQDRNFVFYARAMHLIFVRQTYGTRFISKGPIKILDSLLIGLLWSLSSKPNEKVKLDWSVGVVNAIRLSLI
jgi:hypothetical protein